MSVSPDVSVVVVARNARDDVLRCLRSLEDHAGTSCEAVVVDDGSDDGTAGAIRAAFPSCVVLAKERGEGLPSGRNAALPHVRGRFVLMLDADTEVRPGALPGLVQVLEARPEVGLVGPRLMYPSGELQLSSRRFPPFLAPFTRRGPIARLRSDDPSHRRHLMADWDHAEARPVVWVAGAAQMWRVGLPQTIGAYDERVSSYGGEDLDWCLRVWKAGLQVWYVPQAEIVHVWQQATRQSPYGRQSRRALRDWYYLQWKHRALRRDPRLAEAMR
jgi:GT2 family glycosyltransferase